MIWLIFKSVENLTFLRENADILDELKSRFKITCSSEEIVDIQSAVELVIEPVETPIHDTIYDDIIMSDEEIEADEYDYEEGEGDEQMR